MVDNLTTNKHMKQQIKWDYETNTGSLITQYEDGSILSEPVTSEEAALWNAQHGY